MNQKVISSKYQKKIRIHQSQITLSVNLSIMKKLKYCLLIILFTFTSACVYQANVAQGNFIEDKYLDQVEVGMTRNQVRFLLGTPMIDDPFHENRWDYVYYLTIGRDKAFIKKWVSILFVNNKVSNIDRDLKLNPSL